nr:hypothetical protein [Tanacetum cinerariifolium]
MNNEPPQTLPSFDSTCYYDNEIPVPCISKPNFVNESSNIFNPPPQPPIHSCEFCGNNAQYGHYCTPQAPFINPEPGFDQTKTPQFPIVHPPPQETSIEISSRKLLLLAWDRVSEIKDAFDNNQYKPEDIQALFRKLLDNLQNIHEELAEFINSPGWNQISSGSTTTHSDISLLDYKAFCFDDDHIEEISSGSTITQSDISLPKYDSFIFDLSNDQFPPTDRSDLTHEEFGDELAHIISPPKYDCFYFRNLPDPCELISSLNFGIHENLSSTTRVNLPVEDDYFPLLAYVVWIFLAYLMYPLIPPHLHSFGNKDTIFDPGITINRSYSFKSGLSHRCRTFKEFNTHRSHLNESPIEMLFFTLFPMDQ